MENAFGLRLMLSRRWSMSHRPPTVRWPRWLAEGAGAAQHLGLADGGADLAEVGAAPGTGEQYPDDLRHVGDRAGVSVLVLLVLLIARREAELGGKLADLLEPGRARIERLVAVGETRRDRADQVRVESAEPRIGR